MVHICCPQQEIHQQHYETSQDNFKKEKSPAQSCQQFSVTQEVQETL